MGMGGGGGGGGSSGKVSWPKYFEDWHSGFLGSTETLGTDVVDALNAAIAHSPFTGVTAYDPDTDLATVDTKVTNLFTVAEALDPAADWATYIALVETEIDDHLGSETALAAAEDAFNNAADADYTNSILPKFQRGMQDVNAVMSSAYVVGTALLGAELIRRKAAFSAEIRLQSSRDRSNAILKGMASLISLANSDHDYLRNVVGTLIEAKRIKYVAKKEQIDQDMRIDEADAKWDLEMLTYGGNLLAAGQGGVSNTATKATPVQSALGGALSGASMGGMAAAAMGGPVGWGVGIGAVLGGAMGLFG